MYSVEAIDVHNNLRTMQLTTKQEIIKIHLIYFLLQCNTAVFIIPYCNSVYMYSVEAIDVHNNLRNLQLTTRQEIITIDTFRIAVLQPVSWTIDLHNSLRTLQLTTKQEIINIHLIHFLLQ